MSKPVSIKDLIDLWPSRRELASDITALGSEVDVERVHGWAKTNSIPAKYHRRLIQSAVARGIAVSADLLADLHDCPESRGAA